MNGHLFTPGYKPGVLLLLHLLLLLLLLLLLRVMVQVLSVCDVFNIEVDKGFGTL
jgi:hypothetical protein